MTGRTVDIGLVTKNKGWLIYDRKVIESDDIICRLHFSHNNGVLATSAYRFALRSRKPFTIHDNEIKAGISDLHIDGEIISCISAYSNNELCRVNGSYISFAEGINHLAIAIPGVQVRYATALRDALQAYDLWDRVNKVYDVNPEETEQGRKVAGLFVELADVLEQDPEANNIPLEQRIETIRAGVHLTHKNERGYAMRFVLLDDMSTLTPPSEDYEHLVEGNAD